MSKFEILYQNTEYKTVIIEADNLADAQKKFFNAWYNNKLKNIAHVIHYDVEINKIYDENDNEWDPWEDEIPEGGMVTDPDNKNVLVKRINGKYCYTTMVEEFGK